jgi:hypothetical protein
VATDSCGKIWFKPFMAVHRNHRSPPGFLAATGFGNKPRGLAGGCFS